MRRHLTAAALAALTLSLAGCGEGEEDEGPLMSPGSNCLSCHTGGEPGRFTFAGTVYGAGDAAAGAGLSGVTVTLTGPSGARTLTTNAAGNFYVNANLGSPVDVELAFGGVTVSRPGHIAGSTAGCGGCHAPGLDAGIRVHVGPNRGTSAACATCHGPG
jgi:hypothetical protein